MNAATAKLALIAGELRGPALVELLRSIPRLDREAWTDELLGIEPPPPDIDLPRGAVPYLPCSVDDVLAIVHDVPLGPDDDLVDIGAGLGRVVILTHLLTGVRARGIELQPHLVERARASIGALGLTAVDIIEGNVADMPLDGSVFVLYAPCNGAMLARVIDRLAEVARRRQITVCTIDMELAEVGWLAAQTSSSHALSIYVSR